MWNPEHRDVFEWLIRPYTLEEFRERYYEREVLHVRRDCPGYYSEYCSLAEAEAILSEERSAYNLAVYKDGTRARSDTFVRKVQRDQGRGSFTHSAWIVDPHRVATLFAQGCTIVYDHVGQCSASISRLMTRLEQFFDHRIDGSIFLTPPHSAGLRPHWDPSDGLLLQVEGRKQFRLYEQTVDLPMHQHSSEPPGRFLADVELAAGDLLYLPRGVFHEGRASGDEHSLHLAFGMYPVLTINVLERALANASKEHVLLRKSAGLIPSDDEQLAAIVQQAFSPERLDAARSELRAKFRAEPPYQRADGTQGLFRDVLRAPHLASDWVVALRDDQLLHVVEGSKGVTVIFSGNELALPASAAAIVRELQKTSCARVSDLAKHGNDAAAVVRRLMQAGLAVRVEEVPWPALDAQTARS